MTTKKFYTLLKSSGLQGVKEELVLGASRERTTHFTELSAAEQKDLITFLQKEANKKDSEYQKANTMRRKIISMAHDMGWVRLVEGSPKADMVRITDWCRKYGYLHKGLNEYTYAELPQLVTQFRAMREGFMKSK